MPSRNPRANHFAHQKIARGRLDHLTLEKNPESSQLSTLARVVAQDKLTCFFSATTSNSPDVEGTSTSEFYWEAACDVHAVGCVLEDNGAIELDEEPGGTHRSNLTLALKKSLFSTTS